MVLGFVSPELLPLLRLQIRGAHRTVEIEAIIDTGFNGALSLPQDVIDFLAAPPRQIIESRLADGQKVLLPTFEVEDEWSSGLIVIEATLTAGQPLIGTALLENHELHIEVRDGGTVSIEPLKNNLKK